MRTGRGTGTSCAVVIVALMAVSGCGGLQGRRSAAEQAAVRFEQALRAGDGPAACAALASATRRELEQSAGTACDRAVTEEDLPTTATVRRTDVYGRQARVVLGADTLFLSHGSTGWKITAAGCRPRPQQPYECRLESG